MAAVDAALPFLLPPLDVVRESSPYFRLFSADVLASYELLGYTGYDGKAVWDFIHSKIAFNAGDDGGLKSDFDRAIDV